MTRRLFRLMFCFGLASFLWARPGFAGTVIHVPGDRPTIQGGIYLATNGDIVLVAPGTYNENINFSGRAITVASSGGSAVTIINGTASGPVVKFVSGETSASVLEGFTVQNGAANTYPLSYGGGVLIKSASPILKNNVITRNQAAGGGYGIAVIGGSPQILNNHITDNVQDPAVDLGMGGGGILVNGGSSLVITGNVISNNSTTASGGGVALYSGTVGALIMNNLISGNIALYGNGGGLWIECPSVQLVQNVIVGNSGQSGGGLFQFSDDLIAINNTFAGNTAVDGSAVYVFGGDTGVSFFNNLLTGVQGIAAVYCDASGGSVFTSNDAYEAGNPRIINGNGGATAIVDMGAYEFVPAFFAPKSLSFGSQAVGSSTSKTVKLTNAQDKILDISSFSVPTGYSATGCGATIAAFKSCTLTITFNPLSSGTFKGTMSATDDAGNSPQALALSGSAH